ncbi:MAG: hypothetical protein Kow00127_20250 [Bacteroidales bacterium]
MKKITLLLSAVLLMAGFLFAQGPVKLTGPDVHLRLKQQQLHPGYYQSVQSQVPGAKSYDFTIIGTTWNDLQALNYGNVMQRMWSWPDGTVGSSWLCAGENDDPERGAGYNFFDGSAWGEPNLHVGPPDRMGSPSYAAWGPEGEIIALYRYTPGSGPIYLYKREVRGQGDWVEVELLPPQGVSLVWHSMTTSGQNHETIQLLALTYDEPYMGQENALLYYRSSDGGETWDIAGQIIDGLGSDYFATINSLSYAWANSVGDTIAFTYGFDEFGGRVFRSYDNGDSWEIIPVFNSPFSSLDPPETSDRFGCGVGSSAVALDSQGKVHVAFSRMVKIFQPDGVYYEPYTDGLIYWNEDMEPLDTTTISAVTMDYLIAGGNLVGWILGDETYQIPSGQPNYANALCAFPQFSVDSDDNLFLAWCAVAPGYTNGTYDFRHIVINRSFDGGNSWVGPLDICTDLVLLYSECAFPMMPPVIYDQLHVTYQEDNEPGINQWLNNHPPVENRINHTPIDKMTLTTVDRHEAPGMQLSECWPNPASDEIFFKIGAESDEDPVVQIVSLTGQEVTAPFKVKNNGRLPVRVDISDLAPGTYLLVVRDSRFRAVRKFTK